MKFDYVIGNPPYQEMYNGNSSGANSVYDKFLDASHEVADKVEMIHPARFLFNAGSTLEFAKAGTMERELDKIFRD